MPKIHLALVFVLAIFHHDQAVDADELNRQDQVERDFKVLTKKVSDYKFTGQESDLDVQLVSEPVLRWSNPIRGTRDGAVFLWTHQARPIAMMCAFWRNETLYKHEFQSLTTQPFSVALDEEVVWSPEEAGVQFEPAGDAPRVAKNRALRLVQMRRLASSLQGYVGKEDQEPTVLRLLPKPLYRYPKNVVANGQDGSEAIDGAVFALVQTTDPEILVLLEARRAERGESRWHVAFARMSRFPLYLQRKSETIWSCEWKSGSVDKPYHVRTYEVGN